jgi:hypothetical protein
MKKANTNVKKTTSSSKDNKLPKIGNAKQKSKSPTQVSQKSNSKNKKMNNTAKTNNNIKVLKTSANANNMSAVSIKMQEANEKKKKRIEQEKKEEARDKKVYEQVLKEFQEKNKSRLNTEVNPRKRLTSPKNKNDDIINIKIPKIKISEKKTQQILEEGGMLDAYKYLVVQLCKNGLPIGNLFEYSAYVIKNYEKKWKEKKSKMNKEKLEQYWKEKKEEAAKLQNEKKRSPGPKNNIKMTKEDKNKLEALNRSLQYREINKLIQNMDKSRSSLHHQEFPVKKKNNSDANLPIISDKNKVSVTQKEGKNKKGSPKKGNKSPTSANNKGRKSATKKPTKKSQSPAASQKKNPKKK